MTNLNKKPTKIELKNTLNEISNSKAAIKYGVSRGTIQRWAEEYGIQTKYFINSDLKNKISNKEFYALTPKQIAIHFNVEVGVVKYYRKKFTEYEYSADEIRSKFKEYSYDMQNQGLVKQIKYDDPSLYTSILNLTKDHTLQSNKFTERLYRIFNNYEQNEVDVCKFCKEPLIFYTFDVGYGLSDNHICKTCIPNHCGFGVSKISQELFSSIFMQLSDCSKSTCKFHGNGGELILSINPEEHIKLAPYKNHMNKHKYHIDFVNGQKIIEFDGSYWHKDAMKDNVKDMFLKLRGFDVLHVNEEDYYKNKDETIQRCLNFLNQ